MDIRKGTGFTNLNRVLDANRGNKLGTAVVGGISSQVQGIKTGVQTAQDKFNDEAEKNRLDSEANKAKRDQTINKFTGQGQASIPENNSQPLPAGLITKSNTVTDDDVNDFTKFRQGQYAGPTQLDNVDVFKTKANQLNNQLANSSAGGTQELLKRFVGGEKYGQGQQRLDNLLVDKSQINQARKSALGLGNEVQRAELIAQGKAQSFNSAAQQFGKETEEKLNAGISTLDQKAQEQFAAAQEAEQARLNKIKAVQQFAAGKVEKLDANGNVVRDRYGNVEYDTTDPRGSTDSYAQLDNLANLLRGNGVEQAEIDQLIGGGSFAQGKAQYDDSLNKAKFNSALEVYRKFGTGGHDINDATLPIQQFAASKGYTPRVATASELKMNPNIDQQIRQENISSLFQFLNNKGYGASDLAGIEYSDPTIGGSNAKPVKATANLDRINQIISSAQYGGHSGFTQAQQDITNQMYGTRGIAGQALQKGTDLNSFYNSIANSLGNSQAAQGLTIQGTASDDVRNNYSALERLLGKTADATKFREGDERYTAGQILLNPDQIKKSI